MGRGVGDSASASTFSITLARVTSRRRMRRRSSLSSSATDRQSGHRSAKSARWLIRRSGLSCLLCVWWLKFGSRGTRPSESSTQLRMETGRMPVPHWEPGRQTSNIQHRTSNIQHRTSNIEHRTSNAEHRTLNGGPAEAGTPNRNSRTRRNLVMGSRRTSTTAMPGCRCGGQAPLRKTQAGYLRHIGSRDAKHRTSNIEHRTSNIQHPTLNGGPAEAGTPNFQLSTLNPQH